MGNETRKACATEGCILWSEHVAPCVTGEKLVMSINDKETVLRERDEARADLRRAMEQQKRDYDARVRAEVDFICERERAGAWRDIASDAIDTLWALVNGNSTEWAMGKLESLRKRGQELMP